MANLVRASLLFDLRLSESGIWTEIRALTPCQMGTQIIIKGPDLTYPRLSYIETECAQYQTRLTVHGVFVIYLIIFFVDFRHQAIMSKILVVFGATGNQGGSVINAVLADPALKDQYRIRAITRNASKPAAVALREKGVEVVEADVANGESIRKAMENAHTVFAMTETIHDEELVTRDLAHGKGLVDAAVAANVSFYIYSTLPSIKHYSGGKYLHGDHFDVKSKVEDYIKKQNIKSAFVSPGSFMSIFLESMGPAPLGNGTYAIMNVVIPQTELPLLDTLGDIGKFVALMLADPKKYEGKVIPAATKLYSMQQIAQIMGEVSGKEIRYIQQPPEVMRKFIPANAADRVIDMMLYFQDFGYYGPNTAKVLEESQELAPKNLTTFEEFLLKNKWTLS
ncbi:hscarg dehydrogenase, putative [Talaromyces stipitatus ATCC 10500]|uniref:Hscarg dehydrogenase, putative n=1 Tax=Talaromyces stipitatus (strain ATCC 10500 / CBS 375.48 / QM 6759 / NRRL 1006) TaxID=441959 RepID=B8LXC5_TALSN|nr:hscarg dehydrogenase, putative [Talaromyces stipitatus ATCC 10500]EED23206.1 hscarg dehydrogenase, putative [Talaromyces stipitatus ATCC 10500]